MPTEFTGQYHEFISTGDSPLPPDTIAIPRPVGRPREVPAPGEDVGVSFHEFISTQADDLPPGTMASPRPPGRERLIDDDLAGPAPSEHSK
jgi:hypothetical protein